MTYLRHDYFENYYREIRDNAIAPPRIPFMLGVDTVFLPQVTSHSPRMFDVIIIKYNIYIAPYSRNALWRFTLFL